QAQMMATLLQDGSLDEPSAKTDLAIALGATVLALLICLGIPQALLKAVLLIGSTVIFFVICQIAFTHHNLVLPMMPPLFCFVATGSFGIIFEYTLEQLERRRYRNLLDSYVSESVAKIILEDRRALADRLKGSKQPVSVLFSDIRGFTT